MNAPSSRFPQYLIPWRRGAANVTSPPLLSSLPSFPPSLRPSPFVYDFMRGVRSQIQPLMAPALSPESRKNTIMVPATTASCFDVTARYGVAIVAVVT